jgi:multifunctional methyltransferase subunit TRM112
VFPLKIETAFAKSILRVYFAMVRLITHNLLACHVKGCTSNNFPLEFKDVQVELREAEFNADFLRGFMPKIEWKALVDAARQASALF